MAECSILLPFQLAATKLTRPLNHVLHYRVGILIDRKPRWKGHRSKILSEFHVMHPLSLDFEDSRQDAIDSSRSDVQGNTLCGVESKSYRLRFVLHDGEQPSHLFSGVSAIRAISSVRTTAKSTTADPKML